MGDKRDVRPTFDSGNDFCTDLPKVELHAHLNGSLSEKTIKQLLLKNPTLDIASASTMIEKGSRRSLNECFEMFKVIHRLTGKAEVITSITKSVIDDFVQDNVCYLELRSTPRNNLETGLKKQNYVDAVLKGVSEYQQSNPGAIIVKVLLSIDRRNGLKDATETVEIAKEYLLRPDKIVVGIDLSGDPHIGNATHYIPLLQDAKSAGLKLSLHMAEIRGLDEENNQLLQIPPDRIGHGTFLHENDNCKKIVLQHRIPFEICLTSNVIGGTVESFAVEHHHMHKWRQLDQPYVLCTDDKGVFSTSLSNEYRIASQESGMTYKDVFDLSRNSIYYIFADDDTKKMLFKKLDAWKIQNQNYFV